MPELVLTQPEPEVKRSTGIGASEVAAVLGMSPYRTPFDVWAVKTGSVSPEPENEAMLWGTILQKPILAEYERRTGHEVVVLFDEPRRHPMRDWQIASADALVLKPSKNVEVKTAGVRSAHRWGADGSSDIPKEYFLQVQWQMDVYGTPEADIPVLIGGQEFRLYRVQRDDELIEMMVDLTGTFWHDHIEAGVAPPISTGDTAARYLRQKFPKHLAELRPATSHEAEKAESLVIARGTIAELDKLKEGYENDLKLSIGDAEGIEWDGGRITWKAAKDSQKVNWEAVALEAKAPAELVKKHTTTSPGSRRFLVTPNKEAK